jgi:hypothetical protein
MSQKLILALAMAPLGFSDIMPEKPSSPGRPGNGQDAR